jgi:hypothetical protein
MLFELDWSSSKVSAEISTSPDGKHIAISLYSASSMSIPESMISSGLTSSSAAGKVNGSGCGPVLETGD